MLIRIIFQFDNAGLNDNRQQLAKILVDPNYNVLIVEHKDRLARFGTNYLEILLKELDKKLEIVNSLVCSALFSLCFGHIGSISRN